ncbi:NAD(P)H dehydrogenase (quinone) [Tamaricihabitans halophyticus]|uniref:NAD(P)H dehydrogenase (Quinone) n=1 Tax=Tamaricihabitans halophyticus TaxID=1262583 RepID=A0A4R2QA59_9PSEU|nr:NAD(P)H:quinone oxidoreductase [Tamaricihabitans halophyticus]TCP45817.1 NAD(P)H dehydrogenase (quinone) [Tamaricihabitans halophyticus]
MSTRIAVIYYSSTGNVHALAEAVTKGAAAAGAEVRLRRVAELAPVEVVNSVPAWAAHAKATAHIREATLEDLEWADGYVFGTPTRYGNVAAQLRQFLDTTSDPWERGILADKPVSGFTCSGSPHGGQESTLLSMYTVFMHWGAYIIPMGYTHPSVDEAGGNPYGVSSVDDGNGPAPEALAAATHLGCRVTKVAQLIRPDSMNIDASDPTRFIQG